MTGQTRRNPRVVFLRIFLVFLATLVVILIASEITLRLFRPQVTFETLATPWFFPCFTTSNYSWRVLKANANCTLHSNIDAFADVQVRTNSLGMRNPEVEMPKPAGVFRIVTIGDSFTMGWGVEEEQAYPRRLESILRDKLSNQHIEVVNAGVPATGPAFYYLFLKNVAINLHPDLVIVGFYPYSDVAFDANLSIWENLDADGLPQKVESSVSYVERATGMLRYKDLPLKFKVPILRNSHLFVWVMDRLLPKDSKITFNPLPAPESWCIFKENCHDIDTAKDKARKIMMGIQNLTRESDSEVLVIMFPVEFQIDPRTRPKYGYNLPILPWERDYPGTEWTAFFESKNIASLDLYPTYQQHVEEQLYFRLDDHPTAHGHDLAAQTIADYLIKTTMIK